MIFRFEMCSRLVRTKIKISITFFKKQQQILKQYFLLKFVYKKLKFVYKKLKFVYKKLKNTNKKLK
jgi:hypothetical protein